MYSIIYLFLDVFFYTGQAFILFMLFQTSQWRFVSRYKYNYGLILILQYVVLQMYLHNSKMMQKIVFGNDAHISSSRFSIVFVIISFAATYIFARILLKESRIRICYYVLSFFAVSELVKSAIYVIFIELLNLITDFMSYLYLEKQMYDLATFQTGMQVAEIVWNMIYCFSELTISWMVIKKMKSFLNRKDRYQKWEQMFLLFPSLIGLVICMIVRSLMYSTNDTNIWLLLDERPEMNLLLPCISVLCLCMIVIAAKMLRNLIDESNKRIELVIYKNKAEEMEKHIEDIENLYVGIRGMRHDMKNYIADIDALIKQDGDNPSIKAEMRKYLDSLQNSVDNLEMKYHTGNPVTDVVIQRYVQLSDKKGIEFEVDFVFPKDMGIDAFDLSIIMNNGLENAIEACEKQVTNQKKINLISYNRENMFFIIIRNTFDGTVTKKDGVIQTTKNNPDNHGFGMHNIMTCAEKYYGRAETALKDGQFELAVMLQKQG